MLLLPRPEIQLPSPHPADKLHLLQDIRHHVTTRTGQGIPLPPPERIPAAEVRVIEQED